MTGAELQRFHDGDPAMFRELVRTESPRLLAYARHLTGDPAAAEELVQDAWVHAFRKRRGYDGAGPLMAWVITICRTQFLQRTRSEARRVALHGGMAAAEEVAPDDVVRRAALAAAVAKLADQQRAVVVCRIVEDLSVRETAARLGIAEGTVKATLHQALRNLRLFMEGDRDA